MTRLENAFIHGWLAGGLLVGSIQLLSDSKYLAASCLGVYAVLVIISACYKRVDYNKNKCDTTIADMKPLDYYMEYKNGT